VRCKDKLIMARVCRRLAELREQLRDTRAEQKADAAAHAGNLAAQQVRSSLCSSGLHALQLHCPTLCSLTQTTLTFAAEVLQREDTGTASS